MKIIQENNALKVKIKALENIIEGKDTEINDMRQKIRELERNNSTFMRKFMEKIATSAKNMTASFDRTHPSSAYKSLGRKDKMLTLNQSIYAFQSLNPGNHRANSKIYSLICDKNDGSHIIDQNLQDFEEKLDKSKMEFLPILTQDKDLFRVIAHSIPDSELMTIIRLIKSLDHDTRFLINFVDKLVKLIKCLQHLNSFLTANESIDYLIEVICPLMECDRASVFLIDESTGELWSKKAKGTSGQIRIPYGTGIVGAAIVEGKTINIPDAYEDKRFNKNVDIMNNYRTKTILCVPLKDKKGKILGACQAINKKSGIFSQDDEEILKIVAEQSAVMLQYSKNFEVSVLTQHTLRNILTDEIKILKSNNSLEFIKEAELSIKKIFNTENAKFYLLDTQKQLVGESENSLVSKPLIGLIGEAMKNEIPIIVQNGIGQIVFNAIVDIGILIIN